MTHTVESDTALIDPVVMSAQARVGRTLRRKWRLDVLLGVGGMAAVYAATHRNGTRAALKVLHAELSTHSHIRTRFLREGLVANAVGHPGAVRVIDEDVAEDGSVFLVMELLDGESLEARAARYGGKLPVDEVLAAADQLLDVLALAHERGIVHRDLKPDNVFLTRAGVVKVLDFGIARLRELSTASTATRTGTSMGTPAFMPPEQARGLWNEVDARSDLWAIGALLFALLTGRTVHEGRTTNEQLLSAMTKPAPPLGALLPDLPRVVADVADRALAFKREARWPDARTMQEAVRDAYHRMHDAPISSAAKLTVPPTVPDRTLPSADVAALAGGSAGATAQPVSMGWTGVSLVRTVMRRPELVAASVVGLGAIAAGIIITAALATRGPRTAAPASVPAPSSSSSASKDVEAGATFQATDGGRSTEAEDEVVAVDELPAIAAQRSDPPKSGATVKKAPTKAKIAPEPPVAPAPSPAADWKEQRR